MAAHVPCAACSKVDAHSAQNYLTKHIEREVVRDGRAAWVEEWRITVSSAADLLEIQRGAGAPIVIDGSRITVMAREA